MGSIAAEHPLLVKPKRFTSVVMILVIVAGLAGSLFAGLNIRERTRDSLMARAMTAVDALSVSDVKELRGNTTDLNNVAYQKLKQQLSLIRRDNPDLRFVYLLGRQERDIRFLVDSEASNSPNYSPPGEPYRTASPRLKGAFIVNDSFIEGPVQDTYGRWIAALVPIIDHSTGETIAMLGVEIPVIDYYSQMAVYAFVPLLLAAIPLAGLLRDRKLAAKEQEINQLKIQFLSVASHELRSPLAGLLWATQSLITPGSQPNLTVAQHELLVDMYNSTATSYATVNEILDFSIFNRHAAGKLQNDTVDLKLTLDEVLKLLKLTATETSITVRFSGSWSEQAETRGDISALKRAFMNIVSNAIKYSPDNSQVELLYAQEKDRHVIGVRDHGIGIPLKEQAKVLQGYYRATNATKQVANGTGLGLWVTKLVIEQHGGSLWLDSVENKGTIVYVALPIVDPAQRNT
jgi:signal transduction histidine kinase